MKDYKGREVRYLAVQCCGQCPYIEFDETDEVFRCRRNIMEPAVDPCKEPPEHVCYLLRESDVIRCKNEYEAEKEKEDEGGDPDWFDVMDGENGEEY